MVYLQSRVVRLFEEMLDGNFPQKIELSSKSRSDNLPVIKYFEADEADLLN